METLQRTANRGSISTGYDIDNSLKCAGLTSNEWFYRSSPTASSTQTTFTFSFWIKRTVLEGYPADPYLMSQGTNARFHFAGNTLRFMWDGSTTELESIIKLRDASAWYHIVLAVDTTQSTAANRVKVYVNGVQNAWSNSKYPTQSSTSTWMSTTNMYFNTRDGDGSYDAGQYWAEVCVIDGQQLDPTSFGEFDSDTGIWKPIDVSGLTFGSEGFYLDFSNSASLGADSSGNGNDCTLNNITSADQATDTPTNNFCILNANFKGNNFRKPLDGGTFIDLNGTNAHTPYAGTIGVTKGKWYWESYINTRSSAYGLEMWIGFHTFKENYDNNAFWSSTNQESIAMYYPHLGYYYSWSSGSRSVDTSLGSIGSAGVGKYIGYALNLDDNQITFYYDGSPITNGSNLALNDLGTDTDNGFFAMPALSVYDNDHTVNFGGYTAAPISSPQSDENGYGTFEHAPPSGYYAICSKNLAEYG